MGNDATFWEPVIDLYRPRRMHWVVRPQRCTVTVGDEIRDLDEVQYVEVQAQMRALALAGQLDGPVMFEKAVGCSIAYQLPMDDWYAEEEDRRRREDGRLRVRGITPYTFDSIRLYPTERWWQEVAIWWAREDEHTTAVFEAADDETRLRWRVGVVSVSDGRVGSLASGPYHRPDSAIFDRSRYTGC